MLKQDPYPGRQLRSLIAAALLSPVTRQIPGSAAALGGRAAWAAPLAALPALLFYAWLLSRLRRELEPGEALPEYALRRLGRRGGRAALLALAAWLLVLAGFTLRFGAERLQVSSYPRSGPALFVVCLGIPALLAALGPFRSLLRLGRMILPVLLTALGLILFSAFRSLELTELLPLVPADAPDLLRGALPSLNLLSFALSALFLFPAGRKAGGFRRTAAWTLGLSLLLTALGAAVQGRLGAALSARFAVPFFALVRNLVFFRSLERVEALVVGLWILPDFLLVGLCLHAAQRCLRLALGYAPREGEGRLDLENGRWCVWLCGLFSLGLGLLPELDPAALLFWSRSLIPGLQLAVSFLLIPGLRLAARRREKRAQQ